MEEALTENTYTHRQNGGSAKLHTKNRMSAKGNLWKTVIRQVRDFSFLRCWKATAFLVFYGSLKRYFLKFCVVVSLVHNPVWMDNPTYYINIGLTSINQRLNKKSIGESNSR
jgi:hypothetical protein